MVAVRSSACTSVGTATREEQAERLEQQEERLREEQQRRRQAEQARGQVVHHRLERRLRSRLSLVGAVRVVLVEDTLPASRAWPL